MIKLHIVKYYTFSDSLNVINERKKNNSAAKGQKNHDTNYHIKRVSSVLERSKLKTSKG